MDRSANSCWPGRLGEKERGVGGDPEAWRFGGLHERWARGVGGAEVGAGVERRAGGDPEAWRQRDTHSCGLGPVRLSERICGSVEGRERERTVGYVLADHCPVHHRQPSPPLTRQR